MDQRSNRLGRHAMHRLDHGGAEPTLQSAPYYSARSSPKSYESSQPDMVVAFSLDWRPLRSIDSATSIEDVWSENDDLGDTGLRFSDECREAEVAINQEFYTSNRIVSPKTTAVGLCSRSRLAKAGHLLAYARCRDFAHGDVCHAKRRMGETQGRDAGSHFLGGSLNSDTSACNQIA
jgi:hypothetical protein